MMSAVLSHRGPDEHGVHISGRIALAHRRLSIIDLGSGQQPMFNEDGSVAVIFNGEIYNFRELARELEALGHCFRSRSDTEVIVHAWEAWGRDCVERFRGMFAFALWDRNAETLFLARDRLGVKPLVYAFLSDGRFAFASELKALKTLPAFARRLDESAIEDFFAFGYVPDPKTIFAHARKLPPGCRLVYKVRDRAPVIDRYWDVRLAGARPMPGPRAAAELRERLVESVRLRLESEVPLGAFLSGGIDSGSVVALMAGLSPTPVITCSIGFRDAAFDESFYANQVAQRFNTAHHLEILEEASLASSSRLVRQFDEPFADSSAMPTFEVCRMARRHVTVALSGDGGDETFGGYRRYRLHLAEERIRALMPDAFRARLFTPMGDAFPKLDWLPRPFRAKTTLQALGRSSVGAYFHSMSLLRDNERLSLYAPRFRKRLDGYNAREVFDDHATRADVDDPLSLIQYIDYKTYLPGDINTKVDTMSMANSLEVREPLMDHLLVEWMAQIPSGLKIRSGSAKYLLKEAVNGLLPADLLVRRKMGFAVPLARWFKGKGGQALTDALVSGHGVAAGVLDQERLVELIAQNTSGVRDWSTPLWQVHCFNQFLATEAGDTAVHDSDPG